MSNNKLTIRNYKLGKKAGFTLIELLISISIFVVFIGIVSQSYVGIVRAQRQANGVRKIYSEMRVFFETLAEDARLNSPAYDCYEVIKNPENLGDQQFTDFLTQCPAEVSSRLLSDKQHYLVLIDKEKTQLTVYRFNPNLQTVQLKKFNRDNQGDWQVNADYFSGTEGVDEEGYRNVFPNNVKIKNLGFVLNPAVNPYASQNAAKSGYQFQPLVHVYLSAENVGEGMVLFKLDLQTTFSSRVYSRK